MDHSSLPLAGVIVIDLTTLLPGPLATLMLAESGAEVIKVERPGGGDEMRSYEPKLGPAAANFALLNRGKRSIELDLKQGRDRHRLLELVAGADVLVEQFRPGVADRLGIGYDALRAVNPSLVFCSITGYGQTGAHRARAGHDLNYVAEAGLLGLVTAGGRPVMPHALLADIAGGAYPAVINILLALLARQRDGAGRRLDVAMAESALTFQYASFASGWSGHAWPRANDQLTTGASPRYQLYRARDGRWIAAAPLEDRFWAEFCAAIELDPTWRDDTADPAATRAQVAARIASRTAAEWEAVFAGRDVCCSTVREVEAVAADPHLHARGIFDHRVADPTGRELPALPLPLDHGLRRPPGTLPYPELGELGRPGAGGQAG